MKKIIGAFCLVLFASTFSQAETIQLHCHSLGASTDTARISFIDDAVVASFDVQRNYLSGELVVIETDQQMTKMNLVADSLYSIATVTVENSVLDSQKRGMVQIDFNGQVFSFHCMNHH